GKRRATRRWRARIDPPTGYAHDGPIDMVSLIDQALSGSAVWGKSCQCQGRTLGLVLEPRTGQAAQGALLAAVVVESATESDALSTALLVGGSAAHEKISQLRPNIRTLLVKESSGGVEVET